MNPTPYDENGNRPTVLSRALRFFDDNPDEILTREDIAIKFSCSYETAKAVARRLMQEGVPRSQLPRTPSRPRPRPTAGLRFPDNLRNSERKAIEAYKSTGSVRAAAAATGLGYHSIESYLKTARQKAGVSSSVELVGRYAEAA